MKKSFTIFTAICAMICGKAVAQETPVAAPVDFYSLSFTSITGEKVDFSKFKGKKLLIVNTASKCGYTPQFADLEKLSQQYANVLTVVGFPSNDFHSQDPGTNEEIATFCQANYGVTFQMMEKSEVIGDNRNTVYKWLTDKNLNGWNEQQPSWNFCKYLIDEQGRLVGFFPSKIAPLSDDIVSKLGK